jgi:hypothetical protein
MQPFDKNIPDLPGSFGGDRLRPRGNERVKRVIVDLDVSLLSVEEILAFRAQLEAALPARDLKDLNLARELVMQVLALQAMQQKALEDEGTPVNQLAQAANSLSAALVNLVKVQSDVYNSERFKRIEAVLIEFVQTLPTEQQEPFLTAYEAALAVIE